MRINDLDLISTVVRADSPEARNGFSYLPSGHNEYQYFVPIRNNPNVHVELNHYVDVRDIGQNYILVFNLKHNRIGFVRADQMVEVIDFIVDVKGV